MLLRILRVLELQLSQAVDVQGHGVIVGVHVVRCCFVAWWVCYVCARGTCGGRCGVVRRLPGKPVRGWASLWCVAARWWLSRLVVPPPVTVQVVVSGGC